MDESALVRVESAANKSGEPGVNKAILLCFSCVLLVAISGCGSSSTVTAPNGFLYAANSARPGSVAAFSITTGSLGHITGSPFVTTGNAPYTLAAWPPPLPSNASTVTTKFLYAGIPSSPLGGAINRVLGRPLGSSVAGGIMLMPIKTDHTLDTPQMFASDGDYDPVAVSPSGSFLYAVDLTTNHLAAFSMDSSKGTLTAIGPQGPPVGVAVGADPFNVVVDPKGQFVFVANCDCRTNPSNHGSIQVFSINTDGTLQSVGTFVPGGVVTVQPVALAVSPDGKVLFVASLDNKVYVESIATNGMLSDAVSGAPSVDLAGSTPVSIAVSTDGNYVYTGNSGTHTVSFFLNCLQTTPPTGCPGSGSPPAPLATPSNNSIAATSGTVGVILTDPTNPAPSSSTSASPSGYLYVTDYDHGTIQVFSITSTNACVNVSNCIPGTLVASSSVVNTGGVNPFGLAIGH